MFYNTIFQNYKNSDKEKNVLFYKTFSKIFWNTNRDLINTN